MTESFQFAHPEFLWLLALPLLLLLWKGRRGHPAALRLPGIADTFEGTLRPRSTIGGLSLLPILLALALLIIALARPRLGHGSTDVESSGIDIMLAVDVSGSMEAMDFTLNGQPSNRLEAVKDVLAKFVPQRGNDKIGLVAFAGRPYLVSPLTQDREWLGKRIAGLKIGQVEDGTAIGLAIASATSHLKDSPAKSRIVILLTDGSNNAGAANPETSAEAAKALGIEVYTIGAGTKGEAPFPVRDPFGGVRYQRMKVDVDEPTLQKIADITGAKMFRATDSNSLQKIYDAINALETTTRKLKKYEDYEELYLYALLPAFALFLTTKILGQTLLRTLP